MGRIRNIKPEFFIHDDIYELEQETKLPVRLAFIGLWTQADREGRFTWKPRMLKTQILPYDNVDFERVLDALKSRGFLVQYHDTGGGKYGWIPTFKEHQFINNKEKPSTLPDPKNCNNKKDITRNSRVNDTKETRGVKDIGNDIDINKKENTSVSSDKKIAFDWSSGEFKNLSVSLVKKWKEAFPAVDVLQEIKKSAAWLLANPANRKKNYNRFLTNWLSRTQEKAPRVNGSPQGKGQSVGHTEYTDITAYRKAKERGDKNISLHWSLRAKYPGE